MTHHSGGACDVIRHLELPHDGGDAGEVLDQFRQAGVDLDALATKLQQYGAAAFVKSWDELLACIAEKSVQLKKAG